MADCELVYSRQKQAVKHPGKYGDVNRFAVRRPVSAFCMAGFVKRLAQLGRPFKRAGERGMNEWQSAYSTMAEVAATLSGLLFVSLSVKLNVASSEERSWMMVIAKRSFLDFLAVLGIALFFLIPAISTYFMGWAILWLSMTRALWHVRYLRRYHGSTVLTPGLRDYVMPMIATLLLGIAGIAMLLVSPVALKLLYGGAMALLLGACQNAWRLLIR